ncbi:HYC_CC_PP family protein [Flavobacterium aquidurense]|uniref:HYC_CC_PP family protein n=1 Tax=Flavobacterium aquidurense TaxID=362413 RepID=UPI00371983E0
MNLKKCTGLFLAVLLLVSNIGFAFDVHYCGGKIASVSLNTSVAASSQKKCCGVSEKESSCCKDKVVHFEKKSDNATLKFFFFQFAFAPVVQEFKSVVFIAIPSFKNSQVISYYSHANAPPLFKLYSQYIFYS